MKLPSSQHIIQIFNNSYTYLKDEKSLNDRKSKAMWDKGIFSNIGYVKGDTLFISKNTQHFPPISGNTIFLIDQNTSQKKEDGFYRTADILSESFLWEVLRFKEEVENIDIHFTWKFIHIGMPERGTFKLCNLELNKPVEIKVNGRRDDHFPSRNQRVFIEKNYIILYLGKVSNIEPIEDNIFPVLKKIPKNRKLINLLKNVK